MYVTDTYIALTVRRDYFESSTNSGLFNAQPDEAKYPLF